MEHRTADSRETNPPLRAAPPHEATIVRGAGITIVGAVVGGALIFVNEVMLARFLGAGTYGLFALAFVLARIGQNVSLFGLSPAVLHFMAIYRSKGMQAHVLGTVIAALVMTLIIGCTLGAALMIGAESLARDLFGKPAAADFIRHLALLVPLMGAAEILAVATRGFGFSKYYVLVVNWIPPVVVALCLGAIVALDASPLWVTGAWIAAYVAASVTGLVCVAWLFGSDLWRLRPVFEFRKLYAYALPMLVNTGLYMTMQWSDILLLGYFASQESVGIYRACFQIVLVFDMIIFPVNAAASHILPVLTASDLSSQRDRTFRLVTMLVFGMSVPVFFLIAMHAQAILSVLGSNFTAGAGVLVILAAGRLFRNALGSAAFLLVLRGYVGAETRNAAAAATSNVLLNLLLIPIFGILGAAAATSLGETILNTLRIRQVKRRMGVLTPWDLLLRIGAVASGVAVLLLAAEWLLGVNVRLSLPVLLAWLAASGLVFTAAIWAFGLGREDRVLIKSVVAGRR